MAKQHFTRAPERTARRLVAAGTVTAGELEMRIAPSAPAMSEADIAAHEAASYVRRRPEPTPDLPPLPTEPDARRRALAVRGW